MKPFPFLPSFLSVYFLPSNNVCFFFFSPSQNLLFSFPPAVRRITGEGRTRDRLNTETVRRIEDSTEDSAMENSKFFINAFRARQRKSFGGLFDTAEHISYIILRDKEVDGLRGG